MEATALSPIKHKWLKAADEEFLSLLGMGTWRLVPRPAKRKIIKSKWVFKVKQRADNSIQKLKAHLVAMGFTQVHRIDYNEVFAPTLPQETFCLVCSILAHRKWKARTAIKQTHPVDLFDMESNIIVRCYVGQACLT
jgi:hypothetical protein